MTVSLKWTFPRSICFYIQAKSNTISCGYEDCAVSFLSLYTLNSGEILNILVSSYTSTTSRILKSAR